MSDYADISDLSWDNIQEPKPAPNGTYLLRGSNAVFQPSREEGQNPAVMFVHNIKEPMSDVKSEELEALGVDYDLTENKVFSKVFIEDGSSWMKVKAILEKHGIKTSGKVLDDLKKVKGAEVLAYLTVSTFKRKDDSVGQNNKVETWAAVDED